MPVFDYHTYFSTFIAGWGSVIEEVLEKEAKECTIDDLLEGLVIWQGDISQERVKGFRFFNNSYLLLARKETSSLEELVEQVLGASRLDTKLTSVLPGRRSSFRVMFSKENEPVGMAPRLREMIEKKLASENLFINRTKPDLEFLFLSRSEGFSLFGLRLTRHKDYKEVLHAGELRPELAHLLCYLSEPERTDVFLDPFAGYGAISAERARSFPFTKIYAGDADKRLLPTLKSVARKFGSEFVVGNWDSGALTFLKEGSVDKIVTDPPWGIYENLDVGSVYSLFLKEALRVLKAGGVLIALVANGPLFKGCLEAVFGFHLARELNILVSGKKAVVFKVLKAE